MIQRNFRMNHTFIGVDLHKETHTAVMINCFSEKMEEITIENRPSEFDTLLKWAKKHTPKGMSPVFGLEDVGGYGRSLAIYLIEKKQIVKDVNPSLAYDRRKSRAIYKKSDSIDAESIAEVLLTKI